MRVGSKVELTCKPEYAYGENGSGIVPAKQMAKVEIRNVKNLKINYDSL